MVQGLPDPRSVRFSDLSSNILFINSEILDGDIPNLVEFFRRSVKGVFVETDQFFRFRINPQRLTVRKSKLLSSTYTKSGYTYSHHGNDMTKLSYSGTTGWFHPPNIAETAFEIAKVVPGFPVKINDAEKLRDEISRLLLSGQIDVTQSPVWQKFRRFEVFWDRVQTEMALYFDQRLFRGQLISFNYNEDATDPLQIKYDFEFHAHTDARTGSDRRGKGLFHLGIR